jgi:hypothetical protein
MSAKTDERNIRFNGWSVNPSPCKQAGEVSMSYGVEAYAVDFEVLTHSRGSKDARLAAKAVKAARRLHGKEEGAEVAEAARAWIAGARPTGEPATRVYGLHAIASVLGKRLPSTEWSSMRVDWFDTVDEAIARSLPRGGRKDAPRLSAYFLAGPPPSTRLPPPDDFPVVGYVSAREVAPLRKRLAPVVEVARAARGAKTRSLIEGGSRWHIFEKQSKRGDSRGRMLIWNDRLVLEQGDESSEKKKLHRSREAAWADARARIRKWLKAGYTWNNLELVSKRLYKDALRELESKAPVATTLTLDPRVARGVEQFASWLEVAARRDRGLLFFYD